MNQVSHTFCAQEIMAQFRELLKTKKCNFEWTDDLDEAFVQSKEVIIDAIHKGVQIYDLNKEKCVCTEWCKPRLGFILLQKHCNCKVINPMCCHSG